MSLDKRSFLGASGSDDNQKLLKSIEDAKEGEESKDGNFARKPLLDQEKLLPDGSIEGSKLLCGS